MKRKTNRIYIALAVLLAALASCESTKKNSAETTPRDSSWALLPFIKVDSVNPILSAGTSSFVCPILKKEVLWDEKDVFNPAAVVRDNKVYLLFRAEDKIGKYAGTSRLGLAVSDDGLHFTKMKAPIFFPDNDSLKVLEWEGGVEDPRVVEAEDSTYYMTYTAYDGQLARLLLARSKDLMRWEKLGTVLNGKYRNTWS